MPTPYNVRCSGCTNDIEITMRSMDHDGDLLVEVEACPTCLGRSYETGWDAAKKEVDEL